MRRGDKLLRGQELKSANGKFTAKINENVYFEVYYFNYSLWHYTASANRIEMQTNGNLVLVDTANKTYILSFTANQGDYVVLDNDGGLRVYDSNGSNLWTNWLILSINRMIFFLYKTQLLIFFFFFKI